MPPFGVTIPVTVPQRSETLEGLLNYPVYISNKMHMLQNLFYLINALHVSAVTITYLQEHKTIVTTASGNRYTVLLSAAIVEDLELI
jgi:hypothetical protein